MWLHYPYDETVRIQQNLQLFFSYCIHRCSHQSFILCMRFKQLDPDMKQQRRTIVLLLRFRTLLPSIKTRRYETYAKIARIANLDYNSVQQICKQATQEKRPPAPKKLVR